MLGGNHYYVDWGTYAFRGGLSYFAQLNRPFIEMHFQLQGTVHLGQNAFAPESRLRSGEMNFFYRPPGSSRYALDVDSEGTVFEVLLAPAYFTGLAERYPLLLGPFLEQMIQQKPFFLSPAPLQITPAMWGIIERIRQREAGSGAGSLFLESQILELLGLQFGQVKQPCGRDGQALSRAEVERLYAARDVLLARMTDPPSLAELARHVGTNEFTLKRGFKALFGTSPYAFTLDRKLETVRAYLLDTDLSAAEIASRVGYSDPARLTHAFRKRYGTPPSHLRTLHVHQFPVAMACQAVPSQIQVSP